MLSTTEKTTSPASAHAPTSPRRWAGLWALLLGTFVGILDLLIVTVAVPSIQSDLDASLGDVEWVIAGYTLAYAVVLVTSGRLGDGFGGRRMFCVGTALFGLTSAGCAFAPTIEVLIGVRVAQGLSAALMLPQVLSLIQVMFPAAERRRAIGLYSAVIGFAALAGPLLGGVLIHADVAGLGWRTIFAVNVPLCVLTVLGTRLLVPEHHGAERIRLDLPGALLLGCALVALLLPLTSTAGAPWLALACSPVLFAAFVGWEHRLTRRGGAALLPLRLFRQPGFAKGLPTALFFYGGNGALLFVLSYYLQHGPRLDAFATGLVFAPTALMSACGSLAAGRLTGRFGHRVTLTGAALMILGAALTGAAAFGGQVLPLLPGLVVYGAGGGLVAPAIVGLALAGVRHDDAGAAAGGLLSTAQAANALGVAGFGALFAALTSGYGAASAFGGALLTDAVLFVALGIFLAWLRPRSAER